MEKDILLVHQFTSNILEKSLSLFALDKIRIQRFHIEYNNYIITLTLVYNSCFQIVNFTALN